MRRLSIFHFLILVTGARFAGNLQKQTPQDLLAQSLSEEDSMVQWTGCFLMLGQ